MTAREDMAVRWTLAEMLSRIEESGWTVTAGPDDDPDGAYELRGTVLVEAPPEAGPDAPITAVPTVLRLEAQDLALWWSAWSSGCMHGAQCERVAMWESARSGQRVERQRGAAAPKRKRRKRR